MKKIFHTLAIFLISFSAAAQTKPKVELPEYTFETVKANPITSVKNQHRSGTCWAFSSIGFFESEAIRLCNIKDEAKYPDFSEFFVVSHSYMDRAVKYVQLDGNLTFSIGSETDDCIDVIRDYGIVPNAEMTGLQYGTELPVTAEVEGILKSYVSSVVKNPNKTISTAWRKGYKGVLDAYFGEWPETFTVDGVTYTPQSYRDAMKIVPDDYVSLTSFTHHPFNTWFAIEVCDNWRWNKAYNIPIDELMKVLDDAVNSGYTVAWGADVSAPGFTRDGLAILVDMDAKASSGSDQEHWVGKEDGAPAPVFVAEKVPTQESRQVEWDNKTMTDDHGMQIFGIARDQNGKKYYMVKNSWGVTGKYQGIWYATEAFVKAQTLEFVLHKSALPKELRKKIEGR